MIDDHEAELAGTGQHHGATGDPVASGANTVPSSPDDREPHDERRAVVAGGPVVDTRPADGLAAEQEPPRSERGPADDGQPATGWFAADDDLPAGGGELEKAGDLGLGEAERALLEWALRQRHSAPGEPLLPVTEASPEPAPEHEPQPSAQSARQEPPSAWELFHGSAEEAISALVALGGPDPRDFASPRLTRRAKLVIAFALVALFVVSALGGFVGYRLTHRAAGGGPEAAGRPAQVRTA